MSDIKTAWQEALKDIKTSVSQPVYEMWIKPVSLQGIDGNIVTISTPSKFAQEWLSNHYLLILENALNSHLSNPVKINFTVSEQEKKPIPVIEPQIASLEEREIVPENLINPQYTFETFVVGASNKLAFAASKAVADNPGKTYNPLFIYGGVGLGKTHLLHAIGNRVKEKFKRKKVLYVSSERFINELIKSIGDRKMSEFQNKFRHVDVLLIDDIQFLSGKERTQEEFFHTFNSLYEVSKQVVLTSDRLPRDIPNLEERLRSRFEWGLMADIEPPDFETRVAILGKKADYIKGGESIPPEVIDYIASLISENIRELEGALNRVIASSSLKGVPLTLSLAQDVLRGVFLKPESQRITLEDIQTVVSEFFGIRKEDFSSPKRTQEIVLARQIAMYLARELTNHSLITISRWFGRKNHATVLHACDEIKRDLVKDSDLKKLVDNIVSELNKK